MAALTGSALAAPAPPFDPFGTSTGVEQAQYVLGLASSLAPPDEDDEEEGGQWGGAGDNDHQAGDNDHEADEDAPGDEFNGGYGGGDQEDGDQEDADGLSYGEPGYGGQDDEELSSDENAPGEAGEAESGDADHVSTLPATGSGSTAQPASDAVYVSAPFQQYAEGVDAVTYSPELVPVGSQAKVTSRRTAEGTTVVTLTVKGLAPNRDYGAHVHVNSCGKSANDAGAHYQHQKDPVQPSTDPNYANADNEVWLDFTTDAKGAATVQVEAPWQFQDPRPKSVMIHSERTSAEAGAAGSAGERLACVNVPF
ncbi:Copper/zinc superoxide dismutase (SODC) [Goodfellowiella coeruleoviolacea]|uniref:Copper/zinc superoxide dismutase (SODC) n=2 Tax=Goodfellowiella coeruleoviolacea TaxID=334858 RepID=A0AAE3KGE3_9PSEU|nr:Copper/zinc superoxide dismutase (SODC) [Goodfellowiella coeruleoviolacea]